MSMNVPVSVAISWEGQSKVRKIEWIKAIRAQTDWGLTEAKQYVDRVANGETVVIPVKTAAAGERLVSAARSLGLTVRMADANQAAWFPS